MKNLYTTKMELSRELLEIALKYNQFNCYVLGYPGYVVEMNNPDGTKSMDVQCTVETIYDYYKDHLDQNIDKDFNDTLLKVSNECFDTRTIINALDVTRYHMISEKNGFAPFSIDGLKVLETMKEHVEKNKDHFINGRVGGNKTFNFVDYFDEIYYDLTNSMKR